jgi:beta-N-acetylhexosaminidase
VKNESTFQNLTVEQKIGQLFFIGIPGPSIDDETAELLETVKPGGVCLFARNIKELRQTRDLLDSLSSFLTVPPLLSLDQEGGLVDRLRRVMSPAPAAAKFKSTREVIEFAGITAESLRLLGFNMDFAPVVDVITDEREDAANGMYSRGFGRSREEVVELAGAFLFELQNNGIIGCLKHFPGLGAARADSHEELPQIEIDDDELRAIDLFPYEEIGNQNVEMVMIAHAAYPNSRLQHKDQNGRLLPSSLSRSFVTDLLRNELGYGGLAITDDLEMGAVVRNYGIGEACKMAIAAGNDMLAICAKPEMIREGREAVASALDLGEIDMESVDRSVERILTLKKKIQAPPNFDVDRISELTQQLETLTSRLN